MLLEWASEGGVDGGACSTHEGDEKFAIEEYTKGIN